MPKLCVIPGDGIGKEVIPAAVEVLTAVVPDLETTYADAGWACFLETGDSVPQPTLACLRACGAGLFGAVGSPARKVAGYQSSILRIRRELDLYANIRPVFSLPKISPRKDVDLVVVRENSEGLYVGRERSDGNRALAEKHVSRQGSRRIAQRALDLMARTGRRKLTVVHKANVLPLSDGLFRDSVREVVRASSGDNDLLHVDELLVDVAALKILAAPESLDVVVTTNLYGDILSDAASHWMGGLGFAPSLNWGDHVAVAEPVHGSAPDIAGKGVANPVAAMLSTVLLLRYVWERDAQANKLERGILAAVQELGNVLPCSTRTITRTVLAHLKIDAPALKETGKGKNGSSGEQKIRI